MSADVIARIEGSVQDGGWRASGAVYNDADAFEWYSEFESWFDLYAGGWDRLQKPAIRGHVLPDPWQRTFQFSEAPFSVFTAQEFMKRGEIQGIFFKDVGSPANDHQVNGLKLSSIIQHVMGVAGEYGHCNLVRGVWPEGFLELNIDSANSTVTDEYEIKQGNFWSRLKEIAEVDFYLLYVDKSNTLNYVPHPMFDATLPDPTITLTDDLLLEPLTIERRNTAQVGQVRLQGSTPRGLQIAGKYPTDAEPGPIIQRTGYLATSNSLMNTIAERMYKFENRDYVVTAEMAGAVGLLMDLLDRVAITYTSSADGITWSNKYFWVSRISVELMANFTAKTILTLDAENA